MRYFCVHRLVREVIGILAAERAGVPYSIVPQI
jgi:hypothetical protein